MERFEGMVHRLNFVRHVQLTAVDVQGHSVEERQEPAIAADQKNEDDGTNLGETPPSREALRPEW